MFCPFQKVGMSYLTKLTKSLVKSNNVNYNWIRSCLCGVDACYDVTNLVSPWLMWLATYYMF
jgi:hypothetical protein